MQINSETIVINPPSQLKPQASIIFMHGLGADATDLVDIVPQLELPEKLYVRFIFPNAPFRPITRAEGFTMRAWFNIGLDVGTLEDEAGIRNSILLVNQLITQEIDFGIASENIVLAGFSQGGVVAMQCGLRYPKTLGGILVLSGILLLRDQLACEKHPANQQTPILMMHGEEDSLIPISWARQSFEELKSLELNIELQTYKMDHAVCLEEIRNMAKWLKQVLIK